MQNLEKGLNKSEIFGALFFKKNALFPEQVPFLANIVCCPKSLEYALVTYKK